MKHFSLLKEHRLLFEVAPKGPKEIANKMKSSSRLDSLGVDKPDPEKNAGNVKSVVVEERKPVVEDAARLVKAAAAAKGLENAGADANGKGDKPKKGASDAKTDKPGNPEATKEKPSKLAENVKKASNEIKEALKDGALKENLAELLRIWKEFLASLKGKDVPVSSTESPAKPADAKPDGTKAAPAVSETKPATPDDKKEAVAETNNTGLEATVRTELKAHVDAKPGNNTDTYIASKKEVLPAHQSRLADLEARKAGIEKNLSKLNKEDQEADQKMLDIINEEIAEEKAAIKSIEQIVETVNTLKEQAEAKAAVLNQLLDGFRTTTNPDMQAALKGVEVSVQPDLSFKMNFSPDAEAALKRAAKTAEMEVYKGLEQDVIRDLEGFVTYIGELLTKLEATTPTTPEAEDGKDKGPNDADRDTGTATKPVPTNPPVFAPTKPEIPVNPEAPVQPKAPESNELVNETDFEKILDEVEKNTLKLKTLEASDKPVNIDEVKNLLGELTKLEATIKHYDKEEAKILDHNNPGRGGSGPRRLIYIEPIPVPEDVQKFLNTVASKDWRGRIEDAREDLEDMLRETLQPEPKTPSTPDGNRGKERSSEKKEESGSKGAKGKNPDDADRDTGKTLTPENQTPIAPEVVAELPKVPFEDPSTELPEPTKPISTNPPEVAPAKSEAVTNLENTLQNIVNLMKSGEFGEDAVALEKLNSSLSELSEVDLEAIKDIFIEDVERTNDKNYDIFYDEVEGKFVMEPTYKDLPITKKNDDAKNTFNGADLDKATERASMA